jgi:hypothetical protein
LVVFVDETRVLPRHVVPLVVRWRWGPVVSQGVTRFGLLECR